jgi:hypothetical protein
MRKGKVNVHDEFIDMAEKTVVACIKVCILNWPAETPMSIDVNLRMIRVYLYFTNIFVSTFLCIVISLVSDGHLVFHKLYFYYS